MPSQTLISLVSQITTQHNFKIVILVVLTWIFLTIFHTVDLRHKYKSPPPTYYYTALNNNKIRTPKKIDISLLEASDGNAYEYDNGNMLSVITEVAFVSGLL